MTSWPLDWCELVNEAIRRRRAEGLTQRALAALAGVSAPTVNAFERGDTRLRLEKVIAILEVLGLIVLPGAPDSLPAFAQAARRRWNELVEPLAADDPARQPLGHVEHLYAVDGLAYAGTLGQLREILSGLPKTSGWPPFWVPTQEAIRPVVREGLIECWLGRPGAERVFKDAAYSDFWQVGSDLKAYLQRGHQEDGSDTLEPGTFFDLTLPIWRTAEVLLHASHLVERLNGDPGSSIAYNSRYTGLEGRELVAWANPRLRHDISRRHVARTSRIDLSVATTVRAIASDLEEVIHGCLSPLYDQFDGFELTPALVAAVMSDMRLAGFRR
jgi:transcriptional regulator with XRE-family HTH domain